MDMPEHLEITEDYAHFRPRGHVSLAGAIKLVGNAIAYCYSRNIPKLLADTTGLTGFAPPTIGDRYWIAQDWAGKAKGRVIVAMVVPPEVITPDKFEVIAAANVGQRADVFVSEPEAREWLLSQKVGVMQNQESPQGNP
jgi:hypothetical protein